LSTKILAVEPLRPTTSLGFRERHTLEFTHLSSSIPWSISGLKNSSKLENIYIYIEKEATFTNQDN
jgi:hypothetical protein